MRKETSNMKPDEPSRTALMIARQRAAHQVLDHGSILYDPQIEARRFRLHAESSWQMGHRGLSHDRAPDEQLVVGRLSGLCGWLH